MIMIQVLLSTISKKIFFLVLVSLLFFRSAHRHPFVFCCCCWCGCCCCCWRCCCRFWSFLFISFALLRPFLCFGGPAALLGVCTEFLLGFIEFCLLILDTTLGLPNFTVPLFYLLFIICLLVLLGFTLCDRVEVGFTGFYWVLLGFTGFYWVLVSLARFYWVLLGFTGFYWVLLGFTWFQ